MVSGAELWRSGSDARLQKSAMAWNGKAEHSRSAHCDDSEPENPRTEGFVGHFLHQNVLPSRVAKLFEDQSRYRKIPPEKLVEKRKRSNRPPTTDFTEIRAVPATARLCLTPNINKTALTIQGLCFPSFYDA